MEDPLVTNSKDSEFDALVIGSGPGGYHSAIRLGQLGKSVLLVEKEKLGGVCLNVGCIPSKALITVSKLVKRVRNGSRMGINGQVSIDLPKLQDWKQSVVNQLTNGIAALCKLNKVQIEYGTVRIKNSREAEVVSKEGTVISNVSFRNAVIATGTEPIELPNLKFDGRRVISSTEALDIREPPRSILIVGGGVIGLEIGMMYANLFGTHLTIVELLDQLLPGTDPELVNVVSRNLQRLGAQIFLKSRVKGAKQSDESVNVEFETQDGDSRNVTADYVLVSVGRRPNTKGCGLEKIGVELDARGFIKVDKKMRTNVPNIFAVGDVTGGPLLAHKAFKEGIVAAEVIAGLSSEADWTAVPFAIFTDPEIATVGMTHGEATSIGNNLLVGRFPFSASGKALASEEREGFAKVIAEKESGRILGFGIVGSESTELISEAVLAIEMGASLEDVSLTVHPHPTLSESIMESAENALGKAIHIQNKPQGKSK